jgi:hypothetical protein
MPTRHGHSPTDRRQLTLARTPRERGPRYRPCEAMNENFSLVVMCLFLLGSLAFLAQQLTSYH